MDANTLIINIVYVIESGIIPLIIGIALLLFLWGILKYGFSRDDESRKESIAIIVNGIIILFVMVSVWGFVWLLMDFFGIDSYWSNLLPDSPESPASLIVR
jgi:glucose uptake protein GlcU